MLKVLRREVLLLVESELEGSCNLQGVFSCNGFRLGRRAGKVM